MPLDSKAIVRQALGNTGQGSDDKYGLFVLAEPTINTRDVIECVNPDKCFPSFQLDFNLPLASLLFTALVVIDFPLGSILPVQSGFVTFFPNTFRMLES